MTNNLTYTYNIEEQCDEVYINISVYAQNKVGRGNEIMKDLLLNNNLCIAVTPEVTTCGKFFTMYVFTFICPKCHVYTDKENV